jgi:general secretion pathway protein M
MMELPTGRIGSMLALGITILALAAVWLGAAVPLLDLYAANAENLQRRQMLARRMGELAETLPSLRRQAEASAGEAPAPSAVLEGGSDAIASARLQELVQAMAQETGVGLNRVETLPVERHGAYARIGLRLAFAADWPALIHLLQAIEAAQPRMLVDDLQVRSTGLRGSGDTNPVDASLSVFAFHPASEPSGAR